MLVTIVFIINNPFDATKIPNWFVENILVNVK